MRVPTLLWSLLTVLASAVPAQPVVVTGRVTNELNGNPISTVSVIHHDRIVGTTDRDGRFTTPPLPLDGTGAVVLAFRRLGFGPYALTLRATGQDPITIAVRLSPIPTILEEISVDGDALTIRNPGLIGFYERREEGRGRYLTEREIDRAKSFDLTPYFRYRLRTDNLRRGCTAADIDAVYLDGIRWFDLAHVNRLLAPTAVGGIEVYGKESLHLLPREFIPPGPVCTVTMVWTREPLPASALTFGLYAAPHALGGGPAQTFVGGQIMFPLRQGTSTMLLHAGYDASGSQQGDRWHGTLGISVRPMGFFSPWYTGAGVALTKPFRTDNLSPRSMLFTGLFAAVGPLNPFIESRLIGTDLLIVAGLNVSTN